jgi:hypothetical protein
VTIDNGGAIFSVRLVRVSPDDFDRIYGEIATFMQAEGRDLPGCLETQLFGSEDATSIAIVAQWRSRKDWSHAMWDSRMGELLEEIVGNTESLEFNLYRGDRFPAKASV